MVSEIIDNMVGEESVMEENTQVKKEEAEILENAQQNGEKKWKKYVRIGFLLLVAIFLVRYFYKNYDSYKNLDIEINWPVFAGALLFYFIYQVTLASLWHYITKLNQCSIQYFKAITAYLYSIPGKYILGKVFMLLARVPLYEEGGVPIRKVTVCFFLENICTLLGAAFLFLISLFFFPNDLLNDYKWMTIGLVILFFICINPKIINFFLRILERFVKKDLSIPITYPQMIKVVLLFICNWLVVGVGFYMLVCSIYPVPVSQFLYVAGIDGLSCIIGILAVFTPSGLGVREGIILLGLGLIMPKEYAVIISLVTRLWQTVAEFMLIGIAIVINRGMKFYKKKKEKA